MATPSRYASLRAGIVGPKGATPASKARSGREAAPSPGGAQAALPQGAAAEDVFYGKGAATAKNFRPSYWSYERETPEGAPRGPAAEAPQSAPAEEPVAVIGAPASVYEPETPAPAAAKAAPEERAAVADELAATIEHVMSSRYAGARVVAAAVPARPAIRAVTSESLMAELSAARQGKSRGTRKVASETSILRGSKPAASLLDRAFVLAGLALVLGALLFMSPWRDQFLSLDRLTHFLN